MPILLDPPAASLQGKVAVVTGAAGSVGGAVVARLVSAGVLVVAVDQDRAPDHAPAGVSYLRADVAQPATAPRAIATAEAAFGGLDVLVNAASASYSCSLADMDLTCWNRVLAINLTGTLLACQAAAPVMRRRGGGVIVNLGVMDLLDSPGERLADVVSKEAVVALSRQLAMAMEPVGIRVECIHPGATSNGQAGPHKDVAAQVLELLSSALAGFNGHTAARA